LLLEHGRKILKKSNFMPLSQTMKIMNPQNNSSLKATNYLTQKKTIIFRRDFTYSVDSDPCQGFDSNQSTTVLSRASELKCSKCREALDNLYTVTILGLVVSVPLKIGSF